MARSHQANYQLRNRAQGRCPQCGALCTGYRCAQCNAKRREKAKLLMRERRRLGLATD